MAKFPKGIGEGRLLGVRGKTKPRFTKAEQAALAEMVVIVDTREQRPFRFKGLQTVSATLKAGDYSISGFTDQISIERKSLGDFLGSIGNGRKRFKRELERLQCMDKAAVVVEADYSHVSGGQHPRSQIAPESALATMAVIWMDYGVPVFCCENRAEAEKFTRRVLQRFFLKKRGLK